MEKECRRCFRSKPLSEYYQHKQMFDGHLNVCKDCTKKRVGKHRKNNIEKIMEYDRNRPNKKERVEGVKKRRLWIKQNDIKKDNEYNLVKKEWCKNNNDKIKKYKQKWLDENPEKRRAQTILGNAVRDKRIEKPDNCSKCNDKNTLIHGHHHDYSKPLDVTWLCPYCHTHEHKRMKENLI